MDEISFPKIKCILEGLLFVSKKPLNPDEIAGIIKVPTEIIVKSLEELAAEYDGKGLQIIKVAGGWHMATRVEYVEYVNALLSSPIETTLSSASLETLAIIAYKQPIARSEIERIRGVISDSAIETLLEKRLIAEVGRAETVGRPILYGTTVEFLRHFGLKDLSDLPPLPEGEEEAESFGFFAKGRPASHGKVLSEKEIYGGN